MKIMFIQYGDFREAYNNFELGKSETYKAQRYSVDFVKNMGNESWHEISVLCVNAKERYCENICNHIQVKGILNSDIKTNVIINAVDEFKPTHIILRTPIRKVIKHALNNDIYVLPLFADYFSSKNIREWYRNHRLARLLNNKHISVISNHNYPASESLARIGVNRNKIVPWDWPRSKEGDDCPVRQLPAKNIKLLYVGSVSEDKGAFDCLAAMSIISKSSRNYTLKIIGSGKVKDAELYKLNHGLSNVEILGVITNDNVLREMSEADLVIVPSRHSYPEGMPNTIYEALSMRTPLILSDHPVFVSRFENKKDVVFFKASEPASLSNSIKYLTSHSDLYSSLSEKSLDLLSKLEAPLKWGELIKAWIDGGQSLEGIRKKYSINNNYI